MNGVSVEQEPAATRPARRKWLTLDRIIIYSVLLACLAIVGNDRRILNNVRFLSNLVQDASLVHQGKSNLAMVLDTVDAVTRENVIKGVVDRDHFRAWIKQHHGLTPDPNRSQPRFDLYSVSSGIRRYDLFVRYQGIGKQKAVGLTDLVIYYFWEPSKTSYKLN